MNICEKCGKPIAEGSGIDHELNAHEVVVFCNMNHFKSWIDEHLAKQRLR